MASSYHPFPRRLFRPGLACALVGLLNACSLFSPQVFSPELVPSALSAEGTGPTPVANRAAPSVTEAIQRAEAQQGRYAAAARDQAGAMPALGAGLIGLGALGLFKGVTGGNTKDIAGLGVAGAATYVYGNTVVSVPRQQVYLEGARALGCAIGATRPWGIVESYSDYDNLATLLSDATQSLATLKDTLQAEAPAAQSQTFLLHAQADVKPALCNDSTQPPACDRAGLATDEIGKALAAQCRRIAERRAAICSGKPAADTQMSLAPHPDTQAAFARAEAARTAAEPRISDVARGLANTKDAGSRLWDKVSEIEIRVGSEVVKTVPSLASVLDSVGSLRELSSRFSGGSAAFKEASSGTVQSTASNKALAAVAPRALTAERKLDAASADLIQRASALQLWADRFTAASAQARSGLDDCQVVTGVNALVVVPAAREITLKVGEKQEFFVSGGTGMPSGSAAGQGGGTAGSMVRSFDSEGRFKFVYTPAAGAKAGEVVEIEFADAAGAARHGKVLTMVEATAAKTDSADEARKNSAQKAASGVWEALGLNKDKGEFDLFAERVKACQANKMNLGDKANGVLDQTTQDFILKQPPPCKGS